MSLATIHYTVVLPDGSVAKDTHGGESVTITVDDADVIPGFDSLVKSMKKGEKADYEIKAAAIGSAHSAINAPANTDITGLFRNCNNCAEFRHKVAVS